MDREAMRCIRDRAPTALDNLLETVKKSRVATGKAWFRSLAVPNVHQAGGKRAGKRAARLDGLCGVCV